MKLHDSHVDLWTTHTILNAINNGCNVYLNSKDFPRFINLHNMYPKNVFDAGQMVCAGNLLIFKPREYAPDRVPRLQCEMYTGPTTLVPPICLSATNI